MYSDIIAMYLFFVMSVIQFAQPQPDKPDSAVFFFLIYNFYEKRQKLSEVASIFCFDLSIVRRVWFGLLFTTWFKRVYIAFYVLITFVPSNKFIFRHRNQAIWCRLYRYIYVYRWWQLLLCGFCAMATNYVGFCVLYWMWRRFYEFPAIALLWF